MQFYNFILLRTVMPFIKIINRNPSADFRGDKQRTLYEKVRVKKHFKSDLEHRHQEWNSELSTTKKKFVLILIASPPVSFWYVRDTHEKNPDSIGKCTVDVRASTIKTRASFRRNENSNRL